MSLLTTLLLGSFPAIALFVFIYCKDRKRVEPAGKLFKAFGFGVLSIPVALIICALVDAFLPPTGFIGECLGVAYDAFFMAAIPEEAAKLLMLWLVLRNNRCFDEKFDGIVYAVCVTLGFAAFENVMYISQSGSDAIIVACSRAVLSVPVHFSCGVMMGYFVSLAKFYPVNRDRNMLLAFIVPMLAHGLYDWIVMSATSDNVLYSCVIYLSLVALCYYMWKISLRYIREHLVRDSADRDSISD